MNLAFDSLASFLQMGQHGLYVWLSYGIFIITILSLLGSASFNTFKLKRRRALLSSIKQARKDTP